MLAPTDRPAGSDSAAKQASPPTTVENPFKVLCDWKTTRLKLPLGHPQARAALWRLNKGSTEKMRNLTANLQFSVAATLVQGACLLMAVFRQMDLLQPAWCGPQADLSKHAVHVLRAVKGNSKLKVRPPMPWRYGGAHLTQPVLK